MAVEIEFSALSLNENDEVFQAMLADFTRETGIHVNLRVMDWDLAWNQLVRAAIYSGGPDVSEIGTTWTRDLVGMNVLRLFSSAEVAAMGQERAFVPVAWENALPVPEGVWSIPWVAGARLIFYRPRLLEQAGVNPQAAFSSAAALEETVERLHACGVAVPWAVPTGGTHATLHNVCSWIWNAGGDFVHPDGRSMALMDPETLAGMRDYYTLGRYLGQENSFQSAEIPESAFVARDDVAMTISGSWLFSQLQARYGDFHGEVAQARMPGASFVGGSNLVVWKSSRHPEAALQFVRYLTRQENQSRLAPTVGLLPTRVDALLSDTFQHDPIWQTAAQALLGGRTFPPVRLWGILEERMAGGFAAVWHDWLSDPSTDLMEILRRQIKSLNNRLNLVLQEQ